MLPPGTYTILSTGHPNSWFKVRFTVPAGWRWNGRAVTKGKAVVYFSDGPVVVYPDPCHWDQHQPAPGFYTPDIAQALAAQPRRQATRPVSTRSTFPTEYWDGWTATSLRLTVPSSLEFSRCDHGQYRSWGVGRNSRIQQGPGQRDLIWINTDDHGGQVIVDAATFPNTPPGIVHQIDTILASVTALPAKHPSSFPGLPRRAKPTGPDNDGKLLLQLLPSLGPGQYVYADGRVIDIGDPTPNPLQMPNTQRWLTPQGAQLLRSRVLAIGRSVGLFTRNTQLYKMGVGDRVDSYEIRVGHRLIGSNLTSNLCWKSYASCRQSQTSPYRYPTVTSAQIHALTQINTLITNLPASAWKNPAIHPYIPSHYCVEAGLPPAKLPSPLRELWLKDASPNTDHIFGVLPTNKTRALLAAFAKAGFPVISNHATAIGIAMQGPEKTIGLWFRPALPDGGCMLYPAV